MKRPLCLSIVLSLLLCLCGCGSPAIDPVDFHYCRNPDQFQYFETDSVIRHESRDLTGHMGDLRYMIGLYLAGPLEEGLVCPFPAQTRLLSVKTEGDTAFIELSDLEQLLSDSQFSLACACLTLSCMSFSSCTAVTITSGSRSVTMNTDNLSLFDASVMEEAANGGNQ